MHKAAPRVLETQPAQRGRWDTLPELMPINPVHVALMYNSKVLVISGSGNDPNNKDFQAGVWDPASGSVKTFPIRWDMFCTPYPADIKSVVLIRPGAVTHAFDMEQRLVGLTFTYNNDQLYVKAPANGNIAPPGYYMVFILNSKGVPSKAAFVRLT